MKPAEGAVSGDDATQPPTAPSDPTPGFFPTVAAIESALETSTVIQATQTFVPFIPNILPETTAPVIDETPLIAEVTLEESREVSTTADIVVETISEQTGVEEEVELDHEDDDEGEVEPQEQVMGSRRFFNQERQVQELKALLIKQTLDCGVEPLRAIDRKQEEPEDRTKPALYHHNLFKS